MAKTTASVSKLRDDLKASESKFNIESYLTSSEASKYLSEIPGLEDIISSIKGLIDGAIEFANTILDFIEKILDFLNINNILDALGLKSLLEFISRLVSTGLGVVGMSLGQRASINKLFNAACIPIGAAIFSNGYDKNLLERFALLALTLGLTCSMPGSGFSSMYTTMQATPEVTNLRTEHNELIIERDTANNNPTFIFDTNSNDYIVDQAATDARVAAIQLQIDALDVRITTIESQIDIMFASFVPTIFTNTDAMTGMTSDGIIALTVEIANHNIAPIVSNSNSGLSTSIITSIDETVIKNIDDRDITSLEHVQDPLYGFLENNQYPNIDTAKKYIIDDITLLKELPNSLTSTILVNSIKELDPTTSIVTLGSSPVIRALARRDLESDLLGATSIVTECPTSLITDTMRYIA